MKRLYAGSDLQEKKDGDVGSNATSSHPIEMNSARTHRLRSGPLALRLQDGPCRP